MARRHAVAAAVAMGLQPFNGYTVFGPVSVADLALTAGLGYVACSQLLRSDGWLAAGIRPLGVMFGALTAWLALAGSLWRTTQFVAFALVLGMLALSVRDVDDIEKVLQGALVGSVLISLLTLYSIFIDPEFGGRVAGSRGIGPLPDLPRTVGVPIGSFGSFATYALAPLGYALVRWYRTRSQMLGVPSVIIVGMVVVHQTRATYLALAALLGVVALGLFGRRVWETAWRYAGASVLGLAAAAVAAVAVGWVILSVNVTNALSRFAQFDRAVELIALNPLTGISPPILPYFAATNNIPHNVIFLVGVVGGLPAVTLLLGTFVVAATGCWRAITSVDAQTRDIGLGVAAGWAATLTNLSLAPGFTRAFWLLIGLGSLLLLTDGARLQSIAWSESAVRTSRLGATMQRLVSPLPSVVYLGYAETQRRLGAAWSRSGVLGAVVWFATAARVTYDASATRLHVEQAWKRSTLVNIWHRLQTMTRESRLIRVLID
ncbi:O-antigen ligase family protein [Salinigranum sp. GCM10025319]|uniref:O-antigen ligase family protein n=1 Tax=Salinigranum sp. GCM10025319 TaxID=3252687 RepID=UPI0036128FD0